MKAKVSCLTKTEAIYDHLLKNLKATIEKSIEYQLAWLVEKKNYQRLLALQLVALLVFQNALPTVVLEFTCAGVTFANFKTLS